MTTLVTDTPRAYELGDVNEYGVIATDIIYEGAAVGENGLGYARPLVAGDKFLGFAEQNVDNSTGDAGAYRVRVKTYGKIKLDVGSVTLTDIGKPVFASDDNTFTLTQGSNSYIGRVCRYESAGNCIVAFDATRGGSGALAELTDSSGGSSATTIAAIGGSYSQTEIANAIASLTAQVNALIRQTK
jgi:hypothetical protein